jgi:hypothetical protein
MRLSLQVKSSTIFCKTGEALHPRSAPPDCQRIPRTKLPASIRTREREEKTNFAPLPCPRRQHFECEHAARQFTTSHRQFSSSLFSVLYFFSKKFGFVTIVTAGDGWKKEGKGSFPFFFFLFPAFWAHAPCHKN